MSFTFQFAKINFPVNYMTQIKKNFWIALIIMSLVHPLTLFAYSIDRQILKVPLILYAGLYFILSIGSVSSYIFGVSDRLATVNKVLQLKLSEQKNGKIIKVQSENDEDVKIFVGLAQIYTELLNVCDSINLCFGFQMMFGFGLVFFFTIFTTFTASSDIFNEGHLTTVTISSIAFCIYYNFFLTMVILSCSMLNFEVCFGRLKLQ